MQQCCSIKTDGTRCSRNVIDSIRCKQHNAKFQMTGPNATRLHEIKLIHKRNLELIRLSWRQHHDSARNGNEVRMEEIRYLTEKNDLIRMIEVETNQLGHNADLPYLVRRRENFERMIEERRLRRMELRREQRFAQEDEAFPINEGRDLQNLATDRQNVHTTIVVNNVKQTLEKVLEIQVPLEYRTRTMKTITEIIDQCQPSERASWQMVAKYCGQEEIYDLGPGIYSRVLNAVWQFIKNSEYSEDLKQILSSELEDCIGMCAQGNLSRICNVLSGYMEGLDIRSDREILGDKMSKLMEILNVSERLESGRSILGEMRIPEVEWSVWLDVLAE